jgi:hypothetical protein
MSTTVWLYICLGSIIGMLMVLTRYASRWVERIMSSLDDMGAAVDTLEEKLNNVELKLHDIETEVLQLSFADKRDDDSTPRQ